MRALLRASGLFLGFLTWAAALNADDKKSAQTVQDNAELNRRALEEKARKDPKWYQDMLRDLDAFQALPTEEQERMRQLDRQLNAQDARTHQKLMRVLGRYVNWLDHLPPADRKYIENAPNSKERLKRIRQVRDKQWVQTLPKAVREEIMQAKGPEQAALIKKYRQEEKKRRQEWDAAMKRGATPAARAGNQKN